MYQLCIIDEQVPGADPGFLGRGFVSNKVWGFALLIFLIFLRYPIKMK